MRPWSHPCKERKDGAPSFGVAYTKVLKGGPPASQIDILASLAHPRIKNQRNRFVMIESYFDESGIHAEAKSCVVAGFYGTQIAWRKFEQEWQKVIGDYPELRECGFHSKEFFQRTDKRERLGPYKGWDDAKASRFLDRLVQVILRHRIFPICSGIIVDDFRVLPLQTRQWLTGAKFSATTGEALSSGCPNKSYYLPFSFCVLDAARMSGANSVDKIHFFAGLDRTFHEYASTLYKFTLEDSRIQRSLKSLLGQISFPLAKDTPGLQAADLLAYRLHRLTLDRIKAKDKVPVPPLLAQILRYRKNKQRFLMFDSVRLKELEQLGRNMYNELERENLLSKYIDHLRDS